MADRGERTERADPERIRSEIRGTRADMDETVDAIERKLTPGSLLDEVLDRFRGPDGGGLSDMASGIGNTVRRHPVPLALMGLGLGWMAIERMTGSSATPPRGASDEDRYDKWHSGEEGEDDDEEEGTLERVKEGAASAAGSVKKAVSSAGEAVGKAGRAVGKAGSAGREAGSRATEMGRHATEASRRATRKAREGSRRARRGVASFAREQPLAAGAVSFGVGLAAGLIVPSTRWEEETMGETAEEVRAAAGQAVRETTSEAREVIGEAAHDAREATVEAAHEAREATAEAAREAREKAEDATRSRTEEF